MDLCGASGDLASGTNLCVFMIRLDFIAFIHPDKMTNLLLAFGKFKTEIDEHYDRRERLIKISRDITALSKKMIFSLHRIPVLPILSGLEAIPANITKELQKNEKSIKDLISSAAPELSHTNTWRYQRNISPAIQEYVEAVTFRHYIQYQSIASHAEIQAILHPIDLTPADFILGIADVTGELARRAIAALSSSDPEALRYTIKISTCLRTLAADFEFLDAGKYTEGLRELGKKVSVMQSSVKKVEMGVFQKTVRGQERPDGWVADHRDDGCEE